MTTRRKILFGVFGFYLLSLLLIVVIFGFTRNDNEEFQPQNEFQLHTWIDLPGSLDINKAVMYLIIAGILTEGRRQVAEEERVLAVLGHVVGP